MKKVSLMISLTFLFVLLGFSLSFAQMEKGKVCQHQMKMMSEEKMSPQKCMPGEEEMMQKMGWCMMGKEMGMKMCGMMGEEKGMGCCKMEFFLCCKDKLELTDQQVEMLKGIKMDFLKSKFKMEADLQIAKLELKDLMDNDNASLKEIEPKMRTVEKLKTDMKISHLQAFSKAKEILTPEQKEKMKECHKM